MNQTFDISHIPPMTGSPQDAAAITAEVFSGSGCPGIKGVPPDAGPKNYQVQGWIFS